ncbi:MAG TPA: hypothetical protein VGJ94_18280 [Syntrophorhabdaceae bacterium]
MPVLFTQNFDVIQEKEAEYGEFIAAYLPRMNEMGLAAVGGYYVEVGFGPRVVGVHRAADLTELSQVISSKNFRDLNLNLKSFVFNYSYTVHEPLGRLKRQEYTIQKGVWKFHQYYDLRPGMKGQYGDFIINEHIPALKTIDYMEITGGWNTVIGGTSEIVAEFTFRDPVDIGRLLNNEDFRKTTLKLKNGYVANYKSRILRCTERFDEPKWFRL